MFDGIYKDKRVLITGHTGFKGSWLTLWLEALDAKVLGFQKEFKMTQIILEPAIEGKAEFIDIRDYKRLENAIQQIEPHIIFHLAAQPLVLRSYGDPLEAWSTNLLGTANILNASRYSRSLLAIIVVTSDKCYLNKETSHCYEENDPRR